MITKANEPAGEGFSYPSALRRFAIETAAQLRQAGLSEAVACAGKAKSESRKAFSREDRLASTRRVG